ncbi:MAG: VapC toxin family PIN domain ribonuclease [Gammaproteobacteria bacterium]|nr:MAG: VapC toxin family PIN domain ribonuclease [Gammaproteobacteria bacterium]RKZ76855.1 MAG: VapC toxin family PIN domain ribonuclease [Gammaproteobacteria bacterium]
MNVVDSSGWLEFFADGTNVNVFRVPIRNTSELIVPAISIYEVYKRLLQQTDKDNALRAASLMKMGKVVELNASLAIDAAEISYDLKIPMADSIILATARQYNATLWTQDSDFQGIEGVRYIVKKASVA